jgi:phosphatidylglycerol lysyltransferase
MHGLLPLSWIRVQGSRPAYRDIELPLSRVCWVTFGDIPYGYSNQCLYDDIHTSYPEGFVIRGCSMSMAEVFRDNQCETIRTGAEAVIDLHGRHLEKPSIARLIRQARKRGMVTEMPMSEETSSMLMDFHRETRHAGKPQLEHLFRTPPTAGCRCFIFLAPSGKWLAALTLSRRGLFEVHTELMLKHAEASSDIMEALIAGVFGVLRSEGVREWSLGEVPFFMLMQASHEQLSPLERLMAAMASLWKHAYDFEGLYRFKNKFDPVWRPVMLCAKPAVTPILLADLARSMRFIDLLIHESMSLLTSWPFPEPKSGPL